MPPFRQLRAWQRGYFTLNRRPWIMPDNADTAEVKRVIDTCPSGALKYRRNNMEHKILADDKRFYINDEQGKLIAEISSCRAATS